MRGVVRLGAHDRALRNWIIAIKHNQWEAMGHALGRLLGQQVARCYRSEDLSRRSVVVVPVPMPWIRRVDRGIDHSAVIAAAVARQLRLRCVQPIRQRALGTQVESSERTTRMQRVERFRSRALWCAWRARRAIQARTVILVDDVRTTGATLSHASACLMRMGAASVIPTVLSVKE
jgi:ComF family protein